MDQKDINKLHKEILCIADEVISICEQKGLKYYLAEGSLLGAIRHQAIIPWDDDIDLLMPRQDYDKVVKYLDEELPDCYKVITYERRFSHLRYFIQIESSKIKLLEEGHNKPLVRNAWIDIFPLDGVPEGYLREKVYMFRLLFRRMVVQLSQFDEIVDLKKKNRPWHEKAIIELAQIFRIGQKLNSIKAMKKLDNFLHKYDCKKCNMWINPLSAYKSHAIMPKDYFGSGYKHSFEGRKWNIPDKPDEILKQLYGDYMKLPPEGSRANHHIKIIE